MRQLRQVGDHVPSQVELTQGEAASKRGERRDAIDTTQREGEGEKARLIGEKTLDV